jgi:hypothetical protein
MDDSSKGTIESDKGSDIRDETEGMEGEMGALGKLFDAKKGIEPLGV